MNLRPSGWLTLPVLLLCGCAPQVSANRGQNYTLSTTPRSFTTNCTSMNVREIQGKTLLTKLSGNSSITLSAANALGSGKGTVSFLVECLKEGRVTSSGTFNLIVPSFQGTLLHSDSPDFADDADDAIYEMPQSKAGEFFPVVVRIDRFR